MEKVRKSYRTPGGVVINEEQLKEVGRHACWVLSNLYGVSRGSVLDRKEACEETRKLFRLLYEVLKFPMSEEDYARIVSLYLYSTKVGSDHWKGFVQEVAKSVESAFFSLSPLPPQEWFEELGDILERGLKGEDISFLGNVVEEDERER